VPSNKNGKHRIPESHAGRNERQNGHNPRKNANAKAMQVMINERKDEIKEDMNANRKADRETLKEMLKEMMNANQAKTNENLKEMREKIKSGQRK
jgi:hypothetical protein